MLNWIISYALTILSILFLFKKITIGIATNTLQNNSVKTCIFSILGVVLHYLLITLISFLFCKIANPLTLQYMQYIAISYIVYIGISIMTKKQENISLKEEAPSYPNIFDTKKHIFFYSISNYKISLVLFSIVIQYYQYSKTLLDVFILLLLPVIITFTAILFIVYIYLHK